MKNNKGRSLPVRTILITGSDTGIGKTWIAATVGRLLWQPGLRVQFIKPVETGRGPEEEGDASEATRSSGVEGASLFTLVRFPLPLAPLSAAAASTSSASPPLSLGLLCEKWETLPPADLRIVEGAGGIAVPLDEDGSDWTAFARRIRADRLVLVVPDRLGAINQARLTFAYAQANTGLPSGIWLNEVQPQPDDIRQSNRQGLKGLPLWATQRCNQSLPEDPAFTRSHLIDLSK